MHLRKENTSGRLSDDPWSAVREMKSCSIRQAVRTLSIASVNIEAERAAGIACDFVAICIIAALCMLAMPVPAYAYVDPSVMTYTIQALAGVAVALGAVAGVAFRRTRKALFKLFKIDENVNKVVEGAVKRRKNSGIDLTPEQAEMQANYSSKRSMTARNAPTSFARRLALSAIASLLVVFTLLVVAPLEIYIGGQKDLYINVYDILPIVLAAGAVCFVVLSVCLSCLRGKVFRYAAAVVTALGLCFYIQAMFLNVSLPLADGNELQLGIHKTIAVISLVAWVMLFAIVLTSTARRQRLAQNVLACFSVVIVLVQAVGLGSLFLEDSSKVSADNAVSDTANSRWFVTEDGLYDVDSRNNIVVFVLDTFDEDYLTAVLEADPHALDGFTGFVHYADCTATMVPTRYGVPFLLTGETPRSDERFEDYLYARYERSDYLNRISQAGYSIGLYSDSLCINETENPSVVNSITAKTVNLHDIDAQSVVSPIGTLRILYKCALYRDMTWIFKACFWFTTDDINDRIIEDEGASPANSLYEMNDAAFHRNLQNNGLSVSESNGNGAFRFIHLQGAHYPYTLDENGNELEEASENPINQCRGALKIIQYYLDQMKVLGVYDNATIIVTADHGHWFITEDYLEHPASSIMLVKQTGAAEGLPTVSNDQAMQADSLATVLSAAGASTSGFASAFGESSSAVSASANRTRPYYETLSNGKHDIGIIEWSIDGDVHDFSSWSPTGNEWRFGEGLPDIDEYRASLQQ